MNNLIEIKDLHVSFNSGFQTVSIIKGMNLNIQKGEVLGVVGESGSGKSVTARSIVRLNPEPKLTQYRGEILFEGSDILQYSPKELRNYRRYNASMIFQDPLSSLNPLHTIERQLVESLQLANVSMNRQAAQLKARELLDQVGLRKIDFVMNSLPYELSGGMQQRVMIAMALAKSPKLLIADEPTTALDVTTQEQIIDLFQHLIKETQMTLLFITHDLTIAEQLCDRIAVMRNGRVLELAPTQELFEQPVHPYTLSLFNAIPGLTDQERESIQQKEHRAQQLITDQQLQLYEADDEFEYEMKAVNSQHYVLSLKES